MFETTNQNINGLLTTANRWLMMVSIVSLISQFQHHVPLLFLMVAWSGFCGRKNHRQTWRISNPGH